MCVLLAGGGHSKLHTLLCIHCLRTNKEVQCEGPQARKEEIRDESEINRRHLTEGSQDHSTVPAPSSPSKLPLHSRMTSGKNPSGRARVKCWPHHYMHWHWLGNWLVAGFTANLLADIAYPDRPGQVSKHLPAVSFKQKLWHPAGLGDKWGAMALQSQKKSQKQGSR